MEDFFFFKNSKYNLLGCLHRPNQLEKENGVGLVFCTPFAEEKLWSQRVFVNFARYLANNGYIILRFDYMGHGDSDGNFEDSDIDTRLLDINRAIEVIKERTNIKSVGILGLRLGATLAAMCSEKNNGLDFMVLWEPIVQVEKYLNQCLRSNLTTQMATYKKIKYTREEMINDLMEDRAVNIDGYMMSGQFYRQASSIDFTEMALNFSKPVFMVHISRSEKEKAPRGLVELNQKYCSLNPLSELNIVKEHPFWNDTKMYYQKAENLFHSTLKWLGRFAWQD